MPLEWPFVVGNAVLFRTKSTWDFAENAQDVEAAIHEPVELRRYVLAVQIARKQKKL